MKSHFVAFGQQSWDSLCSRGSARISQWTLQPLGFPIHCGTSFKAVGMVIGTRDPKFLKLWSVLQRQRRAGTCLRHLAIRLRVSSVFLSHRSEPVSRRISFPPLVLLIEGQCRSNRVSESHSEEPRRFPNHFRTIQPSESPFDNLR